MVKLLLSALLRNRREGVEARSAEFPDITVSALSVSVALAHLRVALAQRMRWTKVDTSCRGEAISPVPKEPGDADLAVPIEVEVIERVSPAQP